MLDDAKLKSTVAALIKPDIERIDANVSSVLSTIQDVSRATSELPSSVVATVEGMLKTFREEFLSSWLPSRVLIR